MEVPSSGGSPLQELDILVEHAVSGPALVVRKAGTGEGTGEQACGPECRELNISYVEHTTETLQVVPKTESVFVRWETTDGVLLEDIHYAQPGETVITVFEKLNRYFL